MILAVEEIKIDNGMAKDSDCLDANGQSIVSDLRRPPLVAGNIGYKVTYIHYNELIENFWHQDEIFQNYQI